MDARVQAIRNNVKVGKGSCSSIDECYSDLELAKELDDDGIISPDAAVKWALETEGLRIENALNYRWGEDNDPELKRYHKWFGD